MPFINITAAETSSRAISLTVSALSALGLVPGTTVSIKAGSASTDAVVSASLKGDNISRELLKELGLPRMSKLRLRSLGGGRLHLGPLIGIMISRGKKCKMPPYSSQAGLLRAFSDYSRGVGCLTYVFSPAGVDLINRKIAGYYLQTGDNGEAHWQRHVFPLPDVVYDRILYRSYEKMAATKQITSYFAANNDISYFNPKFLSKWETYTILYANPELQAYLPETFKFGDFEKLKELLELYGMVYIKPVNGSLGKGIIRVSITPGGYEYHYRKGLDPVTGTWATQEEMACALKKFTGGKTYIIQQGLNLMKYRDRFFDLRVLMQVNGSGRWVDTAMVARVSREGSIFPNVAAGGVPKDIEDIWQDLTPTDWLSSPVYSLTKQVSLMAAETLEKALGTFGELGLDIGVDGEGAIWIIEINSKPSRKVFPKDRPCLKIRSIMLPIDFSAYLAGFGPEEGLV